jgi:hypothetical protein
MKLLMEDTLIALRFWRPSTYEMRPKHCRFCPTELTTDNVRILPDDGGAYATFICDRPECWERYILLIGNGGIKLSKEIERKKVKSRR